MLIVEFKDGFVESCCFLGHIKRFFAKDSYQCNICIVASHPISHDGNPFSLPNVKYPVMHFSHSPSEKLISSLGFALASIKELRKCSWDC